MRDFTVIRFTMGFSVGGGPYAPNPPLSPEFFVMNATESLAAGGRLAGAIGR